MRDKDRIEILERRIEQLEMDNKRLHTYIETVQTNLKLQIVMGDLNTKLDIWNRYWADK